MKRVKVRCIDCRKSYRLKYRRNDYRQHLKPDDAREFALWRNYEFGGVCRQCIRANRLTLRVAI